MEANATKSDLREWDLWVSPDGKRVDQYMIYQKEYEQSGWKKIRVREVADEPPTQREP